MIEERLNNRIYKTQERVLKELGEVLKQIKTIRPSEIYKIRHLLLYGAKKDEILKVIADSMGMTVYDTAQYLDEYARRDYEFAKVYYKANGVPFVSYDNNIFLKSRIDGIIKQINKQNIQLLSTTGLTFIDRYGNVVTKPMEQAYIEIVDKAIDEIAMGYESFESATEKQLKVLAKNGLQTIEYASGKKRRLDTALRMNVSDYINQIAIEQQRIMGEQFGADGYEISAHIHPAVDHELLQGRQFSIEEYNKLNNGEEARAEDGTVIPMDEHRRMIGMFNCKHFAYSIVLGIDNPRYTKEELQEIIDKNEKGFEYEGEHYTLYEGTQMQRKMETQIRRTGDEIAIQEAYGNKDRVDYLKRYRQAQIDEYHKFNNVSGLKPYYERLRSYQKGDYKPPKVEKVYKSNNEIFISKEDQIRRLTFKKENIQEQLNETQRKYNNIPKDSTRSWDVSMRKIYESDIKKYNKQLNSIDLENVKDKTINLKDKESCKELLKEVNIDLKDKNLDLINNDVVIENTKHYYEVITKYPFLEQSLQENNLKLEFNDLLGGTIGQAERGGRRIELSIDNFKDKNDLLYWAEYQTEGKYNMPCSKDNYINYFATHELGHTFNYRVLENVEITKFEDLSVREWREKTNEYFMENIYKIAEKNSGKSKDELLELMSDYGKSTIEEGMAELFANANCGKPNVLGEAFDEYFKELLK